jgi:hypothetical protein
MREGHPACAWLCTIMKSLAAGPDGRSSQDGRKVRTPQSSVPDNVRDGRFKPVGRKVPQKTYRPGRKAQVRVKRCGKSAPPTQQCDGQGKPHTEQDQIGRKFMRSFGFAGTRAGSLRHNLRVGRLSCAVMRGLEE